MPFEPNPAFAAFLGSLRDETIWAEILIQRADENFPVRHAADRDLPLENLARVAISDLRKLSTFTSSGQFRPLKSAPTLRRGWVLLCRDPEELWRAMQTLYPGSIADWFAAQRAGPPVTDYREYTARQSGMYRATQLLTNEQVGEVIQGTCASQYCLKRRLWSVEGTPPDSPEAKSLIPCLEPCALLLEAARKAARDTSK